MALSFTLLSTVSNHVPLSFHLKDEYLFDFNNTFEIHDDMEVLKRMGLSLGLERGQVSAENLAKAQSMVPKALEQYVTQLAENGPGEKEKRL